MSSLELMTEKYNNVSHVTCLGKNKIYRFVKKEITFMKPREYKIERKKS